MEKTLRQTRYGLGNLFGFTLIEALIVLGILVVLGGVVMFFVNPVELAKQARDDRRIKEISLVNDTLRIFSEQLPTASVGTSKTVYVSIPDASASCANLGLPGLPSGWVYSCATSANYRKVDGTGWLPVNFKSLTVGSQMAALPIDPINTVSGGQYYTYTPGGSWVVTTGVESRKYLTSAGGDHGTDAGRLELGTDLKLWRDATGLVGQWTFDEGSGTGAVDASGNNNGGSINAPAWVTGQMGSGLNFDGTAGSVVTISDSNKLGLTTGLTIMAWIKPNSVSDWQTIMAKDERGKGYGLFINNGKLRMDLEEVGKVDAGSNLSTGSWQQIVATWNGSLEKLYLNGVEVGSQDRGDRRGAIKINSKNLQLGRAKTTEDPLNAVLDDVRLYNRALSGNEILTIYNQTK